VHTPAIPVHQAWLRIPRAEAAAPRRKRFHSVHDIGVEDQSALIDCPFTTRRH
jgi:hypothetical protein